MKNYLLAVFSLIMVCLLPVVAQNGVTARYNMETHDLRTGLPHNNVNQIFADSKGFVWVSTSGGGLSRYDGYSFMNPVVFSKNALSSNSCRAVAEDAFQRLWVAYDEGTVVVSLKTMNYVVPNFGKTNIARFLNKRSIKVYCDTKGFLWQVTGDSIFRFAFSENGDVSHVSACRYIANTPDITIKDIERNGTVWITIENGLYRLGESGDKLLRKDIAPAMQQLEGYFITDLLKKENTVWISSNEGLYAYDLYNSSLTAYRHTSQPQSIPHDFTTSLALSPEGHLIVGSLKGLCAMDPRNGTFERWNTESMPLPMPSDFVHCLLVRDGQIWIGTETAGIVKLSPQPFLSRNYIHSDNPNSISPNPVNAIYIEPEGTLWIGTVEGGLNRKTSDGGFSHFTMNNSGLSHNSVSMLEPDSKGRLWIGTWGGGLNFIEMRSHNVVHHVDFPNEMAHLVNYIGSLAYDEKDNALWIGANDGVFYYDIDNQRLIEPFQGNRYVRGCIGAVIDKNRHLWMGCILGVCDIDLNSDKEGKHVFQMRRIFNKLDQPESHVVDKISCFCESKDGSLWLGSNGYGLYKRVIDENTKKESFEALTTDDGLANNSVKGMVEDVQGRLWITTDNGLSVYDPRTRTFNNYYERDGLLCQQFYWNSAVRGPDGAIYLGSMEGLSEIRGENDNLRYPVRLSFTRLVVDNQVISSLNRNILDADIAQAKCIRLHESNKSMVIDFSTLTFTGGEHEHCAYRMKGFEDEWIPLKRGEHSVRYTSLKAGKYIFEVRYLNNENSESQIISIEVKVAPFFWKTWWFVLLVLVGIGYLLSRAYRRYIKKLKQEEAEKLLMPIRQVLDETDAPEQLLSHIHNIIDSHMTVQQSVHRSMEADNEDILRNKMSFMQRAASVMEQNYMNSEFGIEQFADAVGMSRTQVSKRLHEETGLSTGQFIRNYRLNVARKLLIENVAHRNIAEIAYKVGFNDPKYFTRCFTNLYGCSPSNYVENMDEVDKNTLKSG